MRILITGGAGFQGMYLTKALVKQGHQVTTLNTYSLRAEKNLASLKEKITIVWGSVTDEEIVTKSVREQDVVFHLASHINVDESIAQPVDTVNTNVLGTLNVLEAVRKNQNRLIHISTCEVYGSNPDGKPIDEATLLSPHSPYAASKAAADRLCHAYRQTYGLNITIVRPFNVFGPGQKDQQGGALIPIFIRQALDKKPLRVFGKGQQTRDYIYIDDLIKGYLLVLENDRLKGEVINLGTGKDVSVLEIAQYISKKLKSKISFTKARPGEVSRFIAVITKAQKLGFTSKVDIWEGIDKCIAWQKAHRNYE